MSSDEETDLNVTVESNDGSLYIPTPQRKVKEYIKNMSIVPSNVCFMDLNQLDKFIKQVNQIRCCATPGCKGALSPVNVKSLGLGGAVSVTYACNGCASQWAILETSSKYELGATTEIGIANISWLTFNMCEVLRICDYRHSNGAHILDIRQVTGTKAKSGTVVEHQRMLVLLKTTSNVKELLKSGAAPLYHTLVTSL